MTSNNPEGTMTDINIEELRTGFENWFTKDNPRCPSIERSHNGIYKIMQTQSDWEAWQGCFRYLQSKEPV